jgi:leader peptidase (prepilin peptidase)/N-methyltransferase
MLYNTIFALLLIGAAILAVCMARADLRRRIIPDAYLFPFMLIGLVISAYFPWIIGFADGAIAAFFGYAAGMLIGFIFSRIHKNAEYSPIGLGDIKLIAAGGIWLGATGLSIAVAVSCILGIIWGAVKKQKYIPFAPFFMVGIIIALLALIFLI